jgi:hypothetical protein
MPSVKTYSKKSSGKSGGKIKNFFKNINYKSPKTHLLIVVLIFSIIGGGLMIYNSFAAAYPPLSMSKSRSLTATATDGVNNTVVCVSTYAKTNFGPIANCIQRNGTMGRVGLYSPLTKKFSPQTGWFKSINYTPADARVRCTNFDSVFAGTDFINSGFGTNQFGQIYRWNSYRWQIAWANRVGSSGKCFVSSSWMDAQAW